jgi:hypothetical protein
MTNDTGGPQGLHQFIDLSKLPDVVSLHIRHRQFDPPRRVTKGGVDRDIAQAVEFEVEVSERFPIRALGPALWIGDQALTVADSDGLIYRFYASEPERLANDAPIALGWSSPSETRKPTRFRFAMPPTP